MNSQKVDNLLDLALDSTTEEREKSLNLNVGYNSESHLWDVVVNRKYQRIGERYCRGGGVTEWICGGDFAGGGDHELIPKT